MPAGNIVLAQSKHEFIASAIMWFSNSQFSHSLVTMPELLTYPMCIEAVSGGVDMLRFDTGYQSNSNEGYQVWSVNVPEEVKTAALQSLLNDLELGYDLISWPFFIYRKICKIFGKDVKNQNNWFNTKGFICSELVVAYLKALGLDSCLVGYGIGSIVPQDLSDIFKSLPGTFKLVETVRLP